MLVPVIFAQDEKRTVLPHKILVEDPAVKPDLTPEEADLYDMAVVHNRKWLDDQRSFPQVPEHEMGDFDFLGKIREQPEKYAFSFDVDNVPAFPGPSLIITGRQDSVAGYRDAWDIVEKYPRATYVVFDRAGHLLEEKDDLIKILMNEWLDRVEESMGLA